MRCWVYRTVVTGAIRVRRGVELPVERIEVRIEGDDTTVHIYPDEEALQSEDEPATNALALRIEP